jgi:hypothetical protein
VRPGRRECGGFATLEEDLTPIGVRGSDVRETRRASPHRVGVQPGPIASGLLDQSSSSLLLPLQVIGNYLTIVVAGTPDKGKTGKKTLPTLPLEERDQGSGISDQGSGKKA